MLGLEWKTGESFNEIDEITTDREGTLVGKMAKSGIKHEMVWSEV